MEEYPRTLNDFEAWFATEQACREYLFRLRWPEGFRCPRCRGGDFWPVRSVLFECRACSHQTSVTAGTIFQDTRKPLVDWFRAMYWVSALRRTAPARWGCRGCSDWGATRPPGRGFTKCGEPWYGRDGIVCRDGSKWMKHLGGLEEGARGRQTERKALIIIAAQEDGPGIGRIRMRRIPDASADSLVPFVEEAITPGSIVHTDGWLGYSPVKGRGYVHDVTILRGKKKTPSELLPRVHRVVSLLKRMAHGYPPGGGDTRASRLLP